MNGLKIDNVLKAIIIVGVLAVSMSVVYHFVVGPELAQRRAEIIYGECLASTADLENATQEQHEWIIEMCVKSGGVDQLRKLKQETSSK